MEELIVVVDALKSAINKLKRESDVFYEKGDNYRGNIRYDAASELKLKLDALTISKCYITEALKK